MPPKNKNNHKGKGKKSFDRPLEKITDDPRFSHVHNDPRFKRPRRKDTKVQIDNRFSSMLKSSEFAEQPKVDRYGRPIAPQTAENELKRFYEIEDESDEDEEEEKTLEELERELAEDEGNLEDEKIPTVKPRKPKYDPMRGQGVIESSDEETTTDEEESDEELEAGNEIPTGDATYRIAAVNMDWDRIRAIDLLKVLNAFKPTTSVIKQVSIYPSEFGKERMAREEMEGPPKELFEKDGSDAVSKNKNHKKNDEDDEEHDEDFDQEALRKYQLDRLKYYYAVIECDSVETAQILYKACDGNEYEASANFFDLRYIPDEMTFDEDEPKEVCTFAPEDYKPSKFSTDALQHTKVKLTWDMDDHQRLEVTRRNFTNEDLQDLDFQAYLASSDDDDSDDDEDVDALREKYRKLLENTDDSAFDNHTHEEEGDMEVTFTPGLTEAANEAVNKRLNAATADQKEETSVETYMRKQREKKQAKKERRQAEREAEEQENDEEDGGSEEDEELQNDPFFRDAMDEIEEEQPKSKESDKSDKKKDKKNKKGKSKEEREEEAREKAELELLMGDNEKGEGFDMRDVLKREKAERRKGKKNKKKMAELTGAQDDFEINVSDPRFSALHENHQFAIDPTSSQFKKTKSMKKLLDARQDKMNSKTRTDAEWKKEVSSAKDNEVSEEKGSSKKKDSSLAQLVASVKRKGGAKQDKIGKRQKS
ncbi:hypothetical protein BDA99DRAFT_172498 [Phascolomyces articulosus]|uniref:NUC153 domain-containing protein n=1 Tax=Phascolomyces articulosus TaxID=60185 RepID=A0AAD5PAY0_9FUNG|nr:hypothetical protein BDA99DRAFT_172498 [Phascolomyces articulosus]